MPIMLARGPSFLLLTLVLFPSLAPAAGERPNVIIVLTDDQGYGDLSCHGNPTLKTPNLDRLHDQSVRLTDFHVAPMCTPTRSQLMTGRDALDNGAMNVSSGRSMIRRGIATMADVFARVCSGSGTWATSILTARRIAAFSRPCGFRRRT
jgi:arylsulfatase